MRIISFTFIRIFHVKLNIKPFKMYFVLNLRYPYYMITHIFFFIYLYGPDKCIWVWDWFKLSMRFKFEFNFKYDFKLQFNFKENLEQLSYFFFKVKLHFLIFWFGLNGMLYNWKWCHVVLKYNILFKSIWSCEKLGLGQNLSKKIHQSWFNKLLFSFYKWRKSLYSKYQFVSLF